MYIKHLSLTNFRNYRRFECGLPAGPLILVGDNAQGKTSLLEAIYYLAGASTPHASSDRQLIHWLAVRNDAYPFLKIVAEVVTSMGVQTLDVRLAMEDSGSTQEIRLKKTILVAGLKKRVRDIFGLVNIVLFLPQDLVLVEGPPSARRRYIDSTICQVDSVYRKALREYSKVISQRNALLKQLQGRGSIGSQLDFWDTQLCQSGAVVIAGRIRAIEEIEHHAGPIYEQLTGTAEYLRLSYCPDYDPVERPADQLALEIDVPVRRSSISSEEIAAGLQTRLSERRSEEIGRGMTIVGPHRDELRFVSSGVDLGIYGSRGQSRSAVLALKLAEMAWMRDRTGECPILLLDEVMAELDFKRRRDLLTHIDGADQVIMTTTDLDVFEESFRRSAQVWSVTDGRVSPATA